MLAERLWSIANWKTNKNTLNVIFIKNSRQLKLGAKLLGIKRIKIFKLTI